VTVIALSCGAWYFASSFAVSLAITWKRSCAARSACLFSGPG
jgi:hypothetical protein